MKSGLDCAYYMAFQLFQTKLRSVNYILSLSLQDVESTVDEVEWHASTQ